MAYLDPDQEAALRRLRAAFGFVEVLEIIDHQPGEDLTGDPEPPPRGDDDEDQTPPAQRQRVDLNSPAARSRRNTTRSCWRGKGRTSS